MEFDDDGFFIFTIWLIHVRLFVIVSKLVRLPIGPPYLNQKIASNRLSSIQLIVIAYRLLVVIIHSFE